MFLFTRIILPDALLTLPTFPALALLAGAACARLWERPTTGLALAVIDALTGVMLLVITVSVSATAISSFLNLRGHPDLYVFYLGHLCDLTVMGTVSA